MNPSHRPVFSIVTFVHRPITEHLHMSIDSVSSQTFADWEWNLVEDTLAGHTVSSILSTAENTDPRIHVLQRSGIGDTADALNHALELSGGDWIILLEQDDLLVEAALDHLNRAIQASPEAGYVYSDEDWIDDDGKLSNEFRKPDWSPERLRHHMYLGHLSALRTDLLREAGGFRAGFGGSRDHDLALRVTEISPTVTHIPEVLYHGRIGPELSVGDTELGTRGDVPEAGVTAVREHLQRIGRKQDLVSAGHVANTYRITRMLRPTTRVSVVIPTRGDTSLVWGERRCLIVETVRSLIEHTRHKNLEIVVVYDTTTPQTVLTQLRQLIPCQLVDVPYGAPFNFSDKCNRGYMAATGDAIVILNDDIAIESDDFIEQLCAPLEDETVGMTGARLLYADGTIQHAGLVFQHADFMHAYLGQPDDNPGYFGELSIDHEDTGLTAACVAVRRNVFEQVGGFSLELPANFNDVDLSYKIRSTGRRLVWLGEVRATHFESLSRTREVHEWEHNIVITRWGKPSRDDFMPVESQRLIEILEATQAQ